MTSATVDTLTAQELVKEASKLISTQAIDNLVIDLERKAQRFQELLAEPHVAQLSAQQLDELAGLMFSVRSKRARLIKGRSIDEHRRSIAQLLYGDSPLAERFEAFVLAYDYLHKQPHRVRSLASELLHYSQPKRYWLWTPWIWEPESGKGALRLVTGPDVELNGDSHADIYRRVGRATAMVTMDGKTSGYTRAAGGLLGTDVFLATVSSLTMFTLYKHRISPEFLRFLPEFAETVRRLLGVHHLAEVA